MYRLPLLLSLLLIVACESKPSDSADSVQIDSFRVEADSIAQEMARVIASMSTRNGRWSFGRDSSDWTARMQGEQPSIIEERIRLSDGSAVRGYFFAQGGGLEQISEQRRRQTGSTEQTIETQIDFSSDGTHRATRRIDGTAANVSTDEITALVNHAAELVAAARAKPPSPSVP